MATQPERVVLTYDDLVQLPNDRNRYEILEGELQVTAAPNTSHQTTVMSLSSLLYVHIQNRRLGRVFTAPCDVLLGAVTVVQPDVLFVSRERRRIILPQYIRGAPDLVVEVLSSSTAQVDRHAKLQLYARYEVPHYWLLDPDRHEFTANTLADGFYRQVVLARDEERVSAPPFPELEIPLAEIWGWDSDVARDGH